VSSQDESDAEEGKTPAPKAKPKRKKLILIGAGAAVLLLGGGGGAYMMMGGEPAKAAEHGEAKEEEHAAEEEPAAEEGKGGEGGDAAADHAPLDVPPLLVNLRSPDGAPHFLKVRFMLVPGPKSDLIRLKNDLPVLLDSYQPFLRELRPEDLSGSAAVFRIKEELLLRARYAIGEGKVKDVLIQDLVQQ
jgi:flagellar FliL protein